MEKAEKTPDEIKKGLECCTNERGDCGDCPYPLTFVCQSDLMKDALTCIQQLEAENSRKDDTIRSLPEPPKEGTL